MVHYLEEVYCNYIYHMMYLLFSGQCDVINNVMTTRYIILSVGTRNVMATSATTKQIAIEINKQ